MPNVDEVLQKLAFQRGVLALLRNKGLFAPNVERAIEDIDSLIESFGALSIR